MVSELLLPVVRTYILVLILVVMEDGLRGDNPLGNRFRSGCVLILVVMEDGLRDFKSYRV